MFTSRDVTYNIVTVKILGILNEIFDDIDESSLISEMAHDQWETIQRITGLDELINTSDYLELGPQF